MYSEELESLIEAIVIDGEITEKERAVLHKRAEAEGVDVDELDIYVDAALSMVKKERGSEGNGMPAPAEVSGNEENKRKEPTHYEKLDTLLKNLDETYEKRLADAMKRGLSKHLGFAEDEYDVYEEWISRKYSTIVGYPLPSTEKEMLEFLTELKPKANISGPKEGHPRQDSKKEDLSFAYWTLFEKGVEISLVKFSDKGFTPLYAFYKKEKEKTNKWWFPIYRFFRNNK